MSEILIKQDEHPAEHQRLLDWMSYAISQHRDRISLDPAWVIVPRICCPEEMPGQEGSIWWDSQVSYAQMMLRCDIPNALRLWIVIHELYELLEWETGDLFLHLLQVQTRSPRLLTHLQQSYQSARNRHIERLVHRHLGYRRPTHMIGEHDPLTSPRSAVSASTRETVLA